MSQPNASHPKPPEELSDAELFEALRKRRNDQRSQDQRSQDLLSEARRRGWIKLPRQI